MAEIIAFDICIDLAETYLQIKPDTEDWISLETKLTKVEIQAKKIGNLAGQ